MLQYLDQYEPTQLESDITKLYKGLDYRSPYDINLHALAEEHGISIIERDGETAAHKFRAQYIIFLDARLPWQQQRIELAHELGHIWMHVGKQSELSMGYRSRQETQADTWAMYALAPTYMIQNCIVSDGGDRLVPQLADSFDVPEYWMDARMKLLKQRLYDCVVHNQLAQAIAETSSSYDYTTRNPFNPRMEYWIKDGSVVHARVRAEV